MSRVWIFAVTLALLTSFNRDSTGSAADALPVGSRLNKVEDNPFLVTAEGTIDSVDNDSLTLTPRGADGKVGKILVLKLSATSQVFMLTTQRQGDKIVLGQRELEPKALKSRQAIAVIYAVPDHVLLTAVALPHADRVAVLPAGVPSKVVKVLKHIDEHKSAPDGYEGGRTFLNLGRDGEQALPRKDKQGRPIRYHEWDVNPRVPGKNRGAERLVTGSDGSAYYTADHYRTFTKIR
jgi:ribonuclease T1